MFTSTLTQMTVQSLGDKASNLFMMKSSNIMAEILRVTGKFRKKLTIATV